MFRQECTRYNRREKYTECPTKFYNERGKTSFEIFNFTQ
jgi:hypothetical protein